MSLHNTSSYHLVYGPAKKSKSIIGKITCQVVQIHTEKNAFDGGKDSIKKADIGLATYFSSLRRYTNGNFYNFVERNSQLRSTFFVISISILLSIYNKRGTTLLEQQCQAWPPNILLIPSFFLGLNLEGNLISNLTLKFPFLPCSFAMGIPSLGIIFSYPG